MSVSSGPGETTTVASRPMPSTTASSVRATAAAPGPSAVTSLAPTIHLRSALLLGAGAAARDASPWRCPSAAADAGSPRACRCRSLPDVAAGARRLGCAHGLRGRLRLGRGRSPHRRRAPPPPRRCAHRAPPRRRRGPSAAGSVLDLGERAGRPRSWAGCASPSSRGLGGHLLDLVGVGQVQADPVAHDELLAAGPEVGGHPVEDQAGRDRELEDEDHDDDRDEPHDPPLRLGHVRRRRELGRQELRQAVDRSPARGWRR